MKKTVTLIVAATTALALFSSCGVFLDPDEGDPSANVVTFAPVETPTFAPTPTVVTSTPEPTDDIDEGTPASLAVDFTLDDIIFLGDSTTYGLKAYGMLSGGKETKQVWTPKSGTLTLDHQSYVNIVYPPDGSEITIREAAEKLKPAAIVITLGVNGVSFMGEERFKSEYTDLIASILEVSPDTFIICQSIFPVASSYEYLKSINNEKIAAANIWVSDVAAENGLVFVDTYSKLVGEDNWLPQNLQNGDGIHLNERGFTIAIDNIKEALGIQ